MELYPYFLSILEQDKAHIVVCDLDHKIIYMNSAADINYAKYGGHGLVGKSVLDCHNEKSREMVKRVVEWFAKSEDNNIVHTFYNEMKNKDVYMVALRDENNKLIGYYEKHEFRTKDDMPFYDIGE